MTKAKVKAKLQTMSQDSLVKLVLELYTARKEAKEYLEFWAEPNEQLKVKEYKDIIRKEFYPSGRKEPQLRFSVCRKAVSDFKKLKPSAWALADLMLFYMECACEFGYEYGDMWEQFYTSVEGNFEKTLQFIADNGLVEDFHSRIQQCLAWSDTSGWGFPDTLHDIYAEIIEGTR